MKKLYLLFLFFTSFFASAQEPFIVTWRVEVGDLEIQTPIHGNDNNYTVDFGDDTVLTNQTAAVTHVYSEPGIYTIALSGDFSRLNIVMNGWDEILSVEQWGDIQWTTMEEAFKDCNELVINATDAPNLSQVTNMDSMFENCSDMNQPINHWDVSNVTTMKNIFTYSAFNQPLDDWDVSNVTNMSGMFFSSNFNQPLNDWVVSNVTDMSGMLGNTTFNHPLDNWDVSSVTNMNDLFYNIHEFNQSLNGWDVSSVTSMNRMFYHAAYFNMPLDNWDVSNVLSMEQMFAETIFFNQDISGWDVSNVNNMRNMFQSSTAFNQSLNTWDVSSVTDMAWMFAYSIFNQPLDNWDVSGVLNMDHMFYSSEYFNQNLSSWQFNEEVYLDSFAGFAAALDSANYDALLLGFIQSGLENKIFDALGLTYCDAAIRNYLIDELGWQITSDSWDEQCITNTVSGNVIFDEDENGCNEDDMMLSHAMVKIYNDTFNYLLPLSEEGTYQANLPQGNYMAELFNLPSYYSMDPVSPEITFEGFGNEQTLNFCLTANETVSDLNITLLPLEEARPGFETDYQLVVQNMGTQSVPTATVTLSFDDTLQTIVTADPAPAATTANSLTFDIPNLQPFESRIINLTTELFTPPTVNGGEISAFTAIVTPNDDDYTPADNIFALEQEVVNSYDPNDKTVLQGEYIYTDETGEYLDYIIRFQNTGTASAITVRIEDILHENLDWTTLMPVSASHSYRVEITEGNHVEFIFDNINLPHEAAEAEGCNGFIAYKIKPVADIQVGDVMEGNASIFFDYNLPIITNVATTQLLAPMSVDASQVNVSCNGESDGSATVVVTGGTESYTYSWSPSGGTEATASGLTAGDYTVTINDGPETMMIDFTIIEPGMMTVIMQPQNDETETGGTAVFSAEAENADSYMWQVSQDGENWDTVTNGGTAPVYSGADTATLSLANVPLSQDGYWYRLMLSNGVECITYSASAMLEVSDVSGTDAFNSSDVSIYPNPAQTEVFIAVSATAGYSGLKLGVYDISGRCLVEKEITADVEKIDMSAFRSGVYLFTLTSDKGGFTKRIVKE